MSSLLPELHSGASGGRSRFEFRVWGSQDEACALLAEMAESETHQEIHDWYLLLGSLSCNAKVRRNRLKVKRLVEERFGFQRWASIRHSMGEDGGSGPIDLLVDELGVIDPPPSIDGAQDPPFCSTAVPAVHVGKRRRRFDLGPIRAEATEVVVAGHPDRMTTVAIEGSDIDELIRLRADLGLDRHPNLAYHLALEPVLRRAA